MHLLEARKKSRHILIGRCRVHLHDILPYVSCSVHQGSCSAQWKVVLSLVHAQLCWPSLSGLLDCSWCPCTETTTSSERKRKDIALEITGLTSITSIVWPLGLLWPLYIEIYYTITHGVWSQTPCRPYQTWESALHSIPQIQVKVFFINVCLGFISELLII